MFGSHKYEFKENPSFCGLRVEPMKRHRADQFQSMFKKFVREIHPFSNEFFEKIVSARIAGATLSVEDVFTVNKEAAQLETPEVDVNAQLETPEGNQQDVVPPDAESAALDIILDEGSPSQEDVPKDAAELEQDKLEQEPAAKGPEKENVSGNAGKHSRSKS